MARSIWKGKYLPSNIISNFSSGIASQKLYQGKSRNIVIFKKFIPCRFFLYNGMDFKSITISKKYRVLSFLRLSAVVTTKKMNVYHTIKKVKSKGKNKKPQNKIQGKKIGKKKVLLKTARKKKKR